MYLGRQQRDARSHGSETETTVPMTWVGGSFETALADNTNIFLLLDPKYSLFGLTCGRPTSTGCPNDKALEQFGNKNCPWCGVTP